MAGRVIQVLLSLSLSCWAALNVLVCDAPSAVDLTLYHSGDFWETWLIKISEWVLGKGLRMKGLFVMTLWKEAFRDEPFSGQMESWPSEGFCVNAAKHKFSDTVSRWIWNRFMRVLKTCISGYGEKLETFELLCGQLDYAFLNPIAL